MKKRWNTAILLALLVVVSCESFHWPPYEHDLREMFNQSLDTLSEIEREMIVDGLPTIGPGLNKAWHHPDIPDLTEAQTDKYASLFGKMPFYANVDRWGSVTHVQLIGQEARFREFLFAFVHSDPPDHLPACKNMNAVPQCGECYVSLHSNWYLEYRWTDGEGIPSTKGCIDPKTLNLDE